MVAALRRRLDRRDVEARAHAVGDVGLLAVDDEAAVDALGARGDRRDVGAGPGLGDGQRGDLLAGDGGRQVAALLVLGAELPHRRRGDADVRADAGRQPARAAARQLLGEDRVVQVVAALAAVLLGVLQAEEADPRQLGEDLVGEPARLLPLGGVRAQLVGDEAPDRLAQRLVLVGEGRVGGHRAGDRIARRGAARHRESMASTVAPGCPVHADFDPLSPRLPAGPVRGHARAAGRARRRSSTRRRSTTTSSPATRTSRRSSSTTRRSRPAPRSCRSPR